MTVWLHTLSAIVLVATASLVGAVFLGRSKQALDTVLMYLVSLSAGVLVGGAMLHLLPHAFEHASSPMEPPVYFLAGFLGFFFLERFLWGLNHDHSSFLHPHVDGNHLPHDRHTPCHHDEGGPAEARHHSTHEHRPLAAMSLLGGALHNLLDGAVVAAAFTIDLRLGWITTAAILFHEIPREFGDFGILVHAGMAPKKALMLNAGTALASLLGAVAVLALGTAVQGLADALVAVTAGTFVYISAANLIPEIHHHHPRSESIGHAAVLLFGVALMFVLALLEPALG